MRFRLRTLLIANGMPKSVVVGAVSAGIFLAVFVLCLVSFSHDPQTPIGLMFSPIYAVVVGMLVGIIHASLGAIRNSSKSRLGALVALPLATISLLGFAWWMISEAVESISR